MEGKQIAAMRVRLGWSQRKLGSKLGLTLRKIRAVETDTDPKPCLEKRIYKMQYIEFLGYSVKTYDDWPVRDISFDLKHEQTRAMRLLESAV